MYRCGECGREFYEPGSYEDYRGEYWGMPCWETIPCCPHCDSDDFEEIKDDEEEEEEYDDEDE